MDIPSLLFRGPPGWWHGCHHMLFTLPGFLLSAPEAFLRLGVEKLGFRCAPALFRKPQYGHGAFCPALANAELGAHFDNFARFGAGAIVANFAALRSEERRVGKECRSRRSP